MFPQKLQEMTANQLHPRRRALVHEFLRHGAEEPYQECLEIVKFHKVGELGAVMAGKKHLCRVHPDADLFPCHAAADIACVLVAGVLVGIVQIRCVYREHGLQIDSFRNKKHLSLEIRRGGKSLKKSPCKEYKFGLTAEMKILSPCGYCAFAPDADQIDATDKMHRIALKRREVSLLIPETAGVGAYGRDGNSVL